jgi:hypothetical protein
MNAKFKGTWKGASQKWFHVDIRTEPQWTNKHLLPPHVEDKRKELEMTPCLKALVKRVTELCQAELEACHCIEEFTLWWFRPIDCREKLAFECPWLADPNRDPPTSKFLNLFLSSTH